MTRTVSRCLSALFLLTWAVSASISGVAQTYTPKTIQFKGDPEYSDVELTAAAGLKKGQPLTGADMNARTQQLLDSGMFDNITFAFNGQDLIFQLTPATTVFPVRIENLPLTPGKQLDESMHSRVPLYHGKVPTEGTLLESVRKAFEEELTSKGIPATVISTPYNDLTVGKMTAMSFSETTPQVSLGEIQLSGLSDAEVPKARQAIAKIAGSAYNLEGSTSALEIAIGNLYHEQGYLEATAHAVPNMTPVVDAAGVHIPYSVTVVEGLQFKLGGVQLAPDMIVTQAAFDKQADMHPGSIVSPEKMRSQWAYILRQYHNKGYMHAQVTTTPAYDRTQATASYAVTATPGPQYTMGVLKLENASSDAQAMIVKAWPMPAGAVFNEGAILSMTATHDVNPTLERFFYEVNLHYTLLLHEDGKTVDVSLRFEKRY